MFGQGSFHGSFCLVWCPQGHMALFSRWLHWFEGSKTIFFTRNLSGMASGVGSAGTLSLSVSSQVSPAGSSNVLQGDSGFPEQVIQETGRGSFQSQGLGPKASIRPLPVCSVGQSSRRFNERESRHQLLVRGASKNSWRYSTPMVVPHRKSAEIWHSDICCM